ncbi:RecQ family ATP-dependent DNA helicase [Chamaesiphon minutus]|uniref:DNA 3'-5' helicase n=1 Tax=Chamaesiphon minutus (strain ATCC 27169 / PCC 6605) TaxID=1173020 RepID=K9UCY7_CHAP6|nr:RecQ family ATP-dependent DNA helicase [Chamaesiphon minutus]AFY92266.1 ATP-dependent DNA helicase, RecQ family [Chamaesiphon minutus PCC 6605]
MQKRALELLRQALNNPTAQFRDGQWEAIYELVENRSRLLVVQRTGWGKSIVYFIATKLLREKGAGITLLISPLLSLMRNQISAAETMGVRAETINSSNQEEWEAIQSRVFSGDVDILLISPERLANPGFIENILILISQNIGLFVVDEAHCISDWGHDFRPDYRRIVRILQALPNNIPVLATTATANNRVVEDIKYQLGDRLQIVRGQLTRESLQLQNISIPSPAARMAWLVEHIPRLLGSGIVYALTLRDADRIAEWLRQNNISAEAYHSKLNSNTKLNSELRIDREDRLLNNEIKVLVATTALGMGFDKPDLGFVIHYQRPGSVVHYYQQVGRAGRAVDRAYGILLSGTEDDDITNYFIQNAFPSQDNISEVIKAIKDSDDGLSDNDLQSKTNLAKGRLNKILKFLSLESPSPVTKEGSKWCANPVNYQLDVENIKRLTEIRNQEQQQMQDYMVSSQCLMTFLSTALDDPNPQPCGKCAVCLDRDLISTTYSSALLEQAVRYLKRSDYSIEPRKRWSAGALVSYGFSGNIRPELQSETGKALSLWGDEGWGKLVRQGKYTDESFNDDLVRATIEMIRRWQPDPFPTWVTCVPSLKRPNLVPDFARRLAEGLQIPLHPVVSKVKQNQPQKEMGNSYQQSHNLDGVFEIDRSQLQSGTVFLIDDMVDSRWTFTVIAALLRQAGSDRVFPLALALNSLSSDD